MMRPTAQMSSIGSFKFDLKCLSLTLNHAASGNNFQIWPYMAFKEETSLRLAQYGPERGTLILMLA